MLVVIHFTKHHYYYYHSKRKQNNPLMTQSREHMSFESFESHCASLLARYVHILCVYLLCVIYMNMFIYMNIYMKIYIYKYIYSLIYTHIYTYIVERT
jgi:hypothetical protein